jgi:hypothetical protein
MSRDLLSEAARTVREASDRPSTRAAETRARVLATHRRSRVRRLRVVSVVLPLAALLVASTAWAASTGRLRGSLRWVAAALAPAAAEAPARGGLGAAATPAARAVVEATAALAPSGSNDPNASDAATAPPSDPATATPSASPGAASVAAPPVKATASGAPSGAAPSASGESAEETRARALYSAAHHAHFASQDWGAALAGWDRYLAAAPRGAFAAEARYNRALCLVRLGRVGEARTALEPFAGGAFGEYRRAEASKLLEALGGR